MARLFARTRRLPAAVCLLVIALVHAPYAATAELRAVALSDYWTVMSVRGQAQQVAGANVWNAARVLAPGDLIGPYQGVATGADGEVTLQRGADAITIYAETAISLPPPSAGGAATRIDQANGTALYRVAPTVRPSFQVRTPYLVAGVRGTSFAITDEGRRAVLIEGRLFLTAARSGAQAELAAGQQGVVSDPAAPAIAVTAVPVDVMQLWQSRALGLGATIRRAGREDGAPTQGATEAADGAANIRELLEGAVDGATGALGAGGEALSGAGQALSGAGVPGVGGTVSGAGDAVSGAAGSVGGIVDSITGD